MGRGPFPLGICFFRTGRGVERTLDLGLVPGFTAFRLWPLGMSLNCFLSLSLTGLLRCKKAVT